MRKEEIRRFDKETLVNYIYLQAMDKPQEARAKLSYQQEILRYRKLSAQSVGLSEKMLNETDEIEFIKLQKKHRRILRRMNNILENQKI